VYHHWQPKRMIMCFQCMNERIDEGRKMILRWQIKWWWCQRESLTNKHDGLSCWHVTYWELVEVEELVANIIVRTRLLCDFKKYNIRGASHNHRENDSLKSIIGNPGLIESKSSCMLTRPTKSPRLLNDYCQLNMQSSKPFPTLENQDMESLSF
jgi:hypothetical protein